jgi:hypothetical protein
MRMPASAPLILLVSVIGGWAVLRTSFLAATFSAEQSIEALPPLADAVPVGPLGQSWPWTGLPDGVVLTSTQRQVAPRYVSDAQAATPALVMAAVPSRVGLQRQDRPVRAIALPVPASQGQSVTQANVLLLARMMAPYPQPLRAGFAEPFRAAPPGVPDFAPAALPPPGARPDRFSGSAWLLARPGGGVPALGNASLGGSQAGVRLAWQPGRSPVALFGRMVSSGRLGRGAEGAIGVSTRLSRRVPVDLVVERRVALIQPARDAFAAYIVGGGQQELAPGGWRLDGYGAAGVVGARRRDLFAEGSVRVDRPLLEAGRMTVRAGGGAWGAAQPGASRLDVGPSLSADWRSEAGSPRLAVDWRQRVAGDAAPQSGPALTLAVDF